MYLETDRIYFGTYLVIRTDGTQIIDMDSDCEMKFSKHHVIPTTVYDGSNNVQHPLDALHVTLPNFQRTEYARRVNRTDRYLQAPSLQKYWTKWIIEFVLKLLIVLKRKELKI